MSGVHREMYRVAVDEIVLLEEMNYVLALVKPQFTSVAITFELNAEVLRDGSHVRDAKTEVQTMLDLREEMLIIASTETIIDVPGSHADNL